MSDIFIAYSRNDSAIAERLALRLREEGWKVFIDRQTLVGRKWHKEIERELHTARAVVVLWSTTSRESDYVLEEAEYGKRKEILFPAFIERVEYPYGFGRIQTADLVGWNQQAEHAGLDRLLVSLQTHLNGAVAASSVEATAIVKPVTQSLISPGQTFRDPLKTGGEGPLMKVIPSGIFIMGSPENESYRRNSEGPRFQVHIRQSFAMGVYVVTFTEYAIFCETTNRKLPIDNGWGRENRPVINVTWYDAQAYCTWLREQTGQLYRLPSEAEWEYACRAGTQTPFYTGEAIDSAHANFNAIHGKTLPVGSFPPNAFGLYDMHGNVLEWTEDCWHKDYREALSDGMAWLNKNDGDCNRRVARGGSWFDELQLLRSAYRFRGFSGEASIYLGFRIARDL
ncbi:MAG: hypothetical protein A4S08_01235 [Proteobacteria bacterium SG_bin4]|nr:MAG: hypothetical protein A4S08_01235 [Proteobacteria bacterium SG_bin4]